MVMRYFYGCLFAVTTVLCSCVSYVHAQNTEDALRYSQPNIGSTARSRGLGGAMGAVGGDMWAASSNPAGLGLFRKSEFAFGLGFDNVQSKSNYIGENNSDSRVNFNIGNLGLITATNYYEGGKPVKKGLCNINFGFTYNRTNTFHTQTYFEGKNRQSSIVDYFAQLALGKTPNQLNLSDNNSLDVLAWYSYLINPNNSSGAAPNSYVPMFNSNRNGAITQSNSGITKGSGKDYSFSFAANYDYRFFIGGTLSLTTVRYNSTQFYAESDPGDSILYFKSLDLTSTLNTRGTGINGKLGVIYRVDDVLRLGLAFHTPTYYSMRDDYSYNLTAKFDQAPPGMSNPQTTITQTTPALTFSYSLTTPMKVIPSVALVFKKAGLISADLEYIDYRTARLYAKDYSFIQENRNTQNTLAQSLNARIGAEYFINHTFFRVGYYRNQSPYALQSRDNAANKARTIAAFGVGFRNDNQYFDVTMNWNISKSFYTPYALNNMVYYSAIQRNNLFQVLLTYGVKF